MCETPVPSGPSPDFGARYEGTLRRYQRRADATVRDTALFSIVTEDWPTVRAALEHRLTAALEQQQSR